MSVAEITFPIERGPATKRKPDVFTEKKIPFLLLMTSLVSNGLVVREELPIVRSKKAYTVLVVIPERTSLKPQRFNETIRRALAELSKAGLGKPQVRIIGKDPESPSACTCNAPSSYILYTNFLAVEPPLRCGDCFAPVPLYRIPPTNQSHAADSDASGRAEQAAQSYGDILYWEQIYRACDRLDIGCGVGERFAMRELYRFDSKLSELGRQICRGIQKATGRPTYYDLHKRTETRNNKKDRARRCPGCGRKWLLKKPWHNRFDFKCDRCHLVSNLSWNCA
jgi:predicted  nucleic acid-binding Zn ribbon protein